ncbi:MAG TPA: isochorismatase family protein [Candidatus Kryptonia bacterium]|nr:isochorismatase family protein [Candidatus Kryptonia bacterium]
MALMFIDVDTQVDFVDPKGALYVPDSREILANIQRLLEVAGERRVTTISPMCAHVVNDPEFQQFPPHCIEGTPGQRRYFDELPRLPRRIWAPDAVVSVSDLVIELGHHYVAKKRTFPMFSNPWLGALRDHGAFRAADCVVFGVATDVCVRIDVLDLCAAGARVRLVPDAIAGIDEADSKRALQDMTAAGARLVATSDVIQSIERGTRFESVSR